MNINLGQEAKKTFADAQLLLKTIIDTKVIRASAALAFYPAASDGDDILLFAPENCDDYWMTKPIATLHGLRQQCDRDSDQHCFCLSDFIAPIGRKQKDYVGLFAVTAGLGADEWANK
jgi:5-methyltetrahydrofolate--homocysteine methyltransferase